MATKRKYYKEVITQDKPKENEIRINNRTEAARYVRRAIWLLQGSV